MEIDGVFYEEEQQARQKATLYPHHKFLNIYLRRARA